MLKLDLTPDPTIPFFIQRTTLEGKDYDFSFQWNQRTSLWYLTIKTVAGETLCNAQALRHGRNVLSRCHSVNRPPGAVFCWCTTPVDKSAPQLGELGHRANIYYATADELK